MSNGGVTPHIRTSNVLARLASSLLSCTEIPSQNTDSH